MLPLGVPVTLAMLAAPRGLAACVAFLLGILAIYLPCGIVIALGARSQPFFDAVSRFSEVWGRRLIAAALLVLGGLLVADGVGWFFGRPLLPLPPPTPGIEG
jgi:hypothetical protein